MGRAIRLGGKERAVIRAIGFGMGMTGDEVREHTQLPPEELVDVLNSLLSVGYIETPTMRESVTESGYAAETFEVNPACAADLKAVIRK